MMVEHKKIKLLEKKSEIMGTENITRGYKNGIEIEKGVVATEDYLRKNFDKIGEMLSIFTAYPDIFLDFITPEDSNFQLFFYQRITLRAIMRYRDIYVTAPRAFSKSFITILGLILQCILCQEQKDLYARLEKGSRPKLPKKKLLKFMIGGR